ncbi:hypothetical protein C8R44DRAFT_885343 [Mycena epipterygia]|nr:hypothetical protein C8R44DRAFT_885343 [Mycena epipterygia]
MSSDDDPHSNAHAPAKKRRVQRACDVCRQKRRACDGLRRSAKRCSYCIDNGMECVYSGAPTTTLSAETSPSGTPPQSSEWSRDSPVLQHQHQNHSSTSSSACAGPASLSNVGPGVELATLSIRSINAASPPSIDNADADSALELIDDMAQLTLANHDAQFLGLSSGARLVRATVQLKEGYTADEGQRTQEGGERPRPWGKRRMEYWTFMPWKSPALTPPSPPTSNAPPQTHARTTPPSRNTYVFPPPPLLSALIESYFAHSNVYVPLLHRPTFERAVADGLHLREDGEGIKFGACVMLLSIQFLEASAPQANWAFSGIGLRMAQEDPPIFTEVRLPLVLMEVDANIHEKHKETEREKKETEMETKVQIKAAVEGELWTRAFWVLVYYDRMVSSMLTRPCGVQYEDFDLDLPTECDDEYWPGEPAVSGGGDSVQFQPGDSQFQPDGRTPGGSETSFTQTQMPQTQGQAQTRPQTQTQAQQAFKQPKEKPSKIAFFNAFLRSNNILAFTLRILPGWAGSAANIANDDNGAINIQWDAHRADPVFFAQSVVLYCGYYHVQTMTHRPFIPMVRQAALTALPSLAICTNAARSCSHIADASRRRMGGTPVIILLAAGADDRGRGAAAEGVKRQAHGARAAHEYGDRGGLYWDIPNELASVGHVPLPAPPSAALHPNPTPISAHPLPERKRAHEPDAEEVRYTRVQEVEYDAHTHAHTPWMDPMQPVHDVLHYQQRQQRRHSGFDDFQWVGAPQQEQGPALPMYTADLGRLPVYQQQSTFLPYARPGPS